MEARKLIALGFVIFMVLVGFGAVIVAAESGSGTSNGQGYQEPQGDPERAENQTQNQTGFCEGNNTSQQNQQQNQTGPSGPNNGNGTMTQNQSGPNGPNGPNGTNECNCTGNCTQQQNQTQNQAGNCTGNQTKEQNKEQAQDCNGTGNQTQEQEKEQNADGGGAQNQEKNENGGTGSGSSSSGNQEQQQNGTGDQSKEQNKEQNQDGGGAQNQENNNEGNGNGPGDENSAENQFQNQYGKDDKEQTKNQWKNQYRYQIEDGIKNGTVVQECNISKKDGNVYMNSYEYQKGMSVEIDEQSQNKVQVRVSAEFKEGKVLILNIEESALKVKSANQLKIRFDGNEISEGNIAEVLDGNGEEAQYAMALGESGGQYIVYIPHFSEHVITIESFIEPEEAIPLIGLGAAIITIILLVIVIFRIGKYRK
jgi:hypothetical protein